MKVVNFTRPPVRYIEVRAIDRRRGHWQGFYAGDEWTEPFRTTIASRFLVVDGLRRLERCSGLPLIEMPGLFEEIAA